MHYRTRRSLIFAAAVASVARIAIASPTWTGAGDDANFSTPQNWAAGVAPLAGDLVTFDGLNGLAPNNDLATGTGLTGITFGSGASAFTVGGNAITLDGDITDNAPSRLQMIALPIALSGTRSIFVADRASLAVTGAISGDSFGLNKTGNGSLILSAANSFTGPTNLLGGRLVLDFSQPSAPLSGKNIIAPTSPLALGGA